MIIKHAGIIHQGKCHCLEELNSIFSYNYYLLTACLFLFSTNVCNFGVFYSALK